jgi:hypothetical protein
MVPWIRKSLKITFLKTIISTKLIRASVKILCQRVNVFLKVLRNLLKEFPIDGNNKIAIKIGNVNKIIQTKVSACPFPAILPNPSDIIFLRGLR